MQLLSPVIAFFRAYQLNRQLREIERHVDALPQRSRTQLRVQTLREIGNAMRGEFPHLYGTAPEARYLPWGQGTDAGYERARSNNPDVALRASRYGWPWPITKPSIRRGTGCCRNIAGCCNW